MKFIFALCSFLIVQTITAQDNYRIVRKADSLVASYQFEKALEVLTQGDTTNTEILLRIGNCNLRLGASRSAIGNFERILTMDSSNLTALNQLGQLYMREGDFDKSLDTYYRLLDFDSANSYYYKQAAFGAARLENKPLAAQLYFKALKLNPKDTEASLAFGNILMELEQFKMVDSIVAIALANDPQSKNMLLLKTRSAFEQHHNEVVISTVNNLLTKTDTTIAFARYLGISYFNMKEYEKSKTCMLYLLKNKFEGESMYYYLGVASRELGEVSESIQYLKLAVDLSISDNIVSYYTQLGQSYEKTGNSKAAINAYRSAYSYSKKGILLYHLARNYDLYYSDKTKAAEYYKRYLASEDTTRLIKDYARRRMQDMGYY